MLFDLLEVEVLGDLRRIIPPPWSEFVIVASSIACGAAVGFERERHDKPAGLRTLILICLGATIYTIASIALGGIERARIAAQIVTGVGFLGAGSILQDRQKIKGLTTAASIWATAAVGIIVGAGYALPGLALSIVILVTLSLLSRVEEWFSGRCDKQLGTLLYRAEQGRAQPRIQRVLDESTASRLVTPEALDPDGRARLTFEYCRTHREHRAILAKLADLHEVEAIEAPLK